MTGLARRRFYKPERAPARAKGVIGKEAPISVPDATTTEIKTALYALCKEAGMIIGRGAEYEPIRDEYTVIGKSKATGKAQEIKVQGAEVGSVIRIARMLNGGKLNRADSRLQELRRPSIAQ
jgi:hypothetical protein